MEHELKQMFEMKETEMAVPPTLSPELRNRIGRQRMVMGGFAAAAALILVIGGFAGARSLSNDAAPISPADETQEKSPSVETADDVSDSAWVERLMNLKQTTFVSPINGYSFKYPDRGGLEPAKEPWDPANQRSPINGFHIDEFDFVETGYGAAFISASTKIPEGVSIDEWVGEAVAGYAKPLQLPVGCFGPRSQQEWITVDGQPGRISDDCANDTVATVVTDGRLYLFLLAYGAPTRDEGRQVFNAWIDTIELTPETAAVP